MALLLAGASFVVALALGTSATTASADNVSDAQALFALTNQTRADNGLPPLQWDASAANIASWWSGLTANSQTLSHNSHLVDQIGSQDTAYWTRIGENVGYAYSVSAVHNAFLNSPAHLANILGDYNRVGIGVVDDGTGRLWVTVDFVKGPPLIVQPVQWLHPRTTAASAQITVAPACTSCRRLTTSSMRRS